MANSSSPIYDAIVQAQASKEVTANGQFDALSNALLYGRRQSTTGGLEWGYFGGNVLINGTVTQIANGTLTLTAASTNYIEATPSTGAVSSNTTGFTPGKTPLYTVVTGASSITSYTDLRMLVRGHDGLLSKALSDADTTLTQVEAWNDILQFTGTLTTGRNVVVPLFPRQYTVFNNTTGGFALTFIGATGTGIAVAAGKRAIVYADGTNVVRVTQDT